jgi:predicted dehydrogenase
MTRSLRVAAAGTGYFSRFQYRAWLRMPEVELVGICNRTLARAEGFAGEFGGRAFSEVDAMLDATRPDLLDIVTPPETHLAAIRAAAARGIDVICQKPFCQDLAEAEQAVAIAEAAGIALVVHENFRFQPWHREVKRLLGEDRLGAVYQATFRLRPGDGRGERAYLDRQPTFQRMPRFLVHETAIHLIDVFRFYFGEAASVYATLRRLNPAIAGEDAGLIVLGMANGTQAVFDGNRLSDVKAENRRLTMGEMLLEGERGTLRLDGDGHLYERAHGSNDERRIPYDWEDRDFGGDCVYHFQRHVVDARLRGLPCVNTGWDYLANVRIVEAAYASHRDGRRIDLGSGPGQPR